MNTRLQVEHPVTEQVTGLDLVRAQLLVANGEPLPWTQEQVTQRGHAIEARIYAEDPAHGFIPQAGRLTRYREPRRPGIRVDAGVVEGGDVPVYYDPMIAKVIATAETRALAIARLSAALREFEIAGIKTNRPFLIKILESDSFRDAAIDTAYLDRHGDSIAESSVVDLESSVQLAPSPESSAPSRFDPWDGPPSLAAGTRASAWQAPAARKRPSTSAGRNLISPMPATVIKVHVKAGDAVKKGDIVVVLEAMKMELSLRALGEGVVSAVRCREGELVQADATLIEFA